MKGKHGKHKKAATGDATQLFAFTRKRKKILPLLLLARLHTTGRYQKEDASILQSQGSGKPFFIKPIRILVTYKKRTLSISDLDGSGKPCPSIRLTSSNIREEDAVDSIDLRALVNLSFIKCNTRPQWARLYPKQNFTRIFKFKIQSLCNDIC